MPGRITPNIMAQMPSGLAAVFIGSVSIMIRPVY